MEKTVAIIHYNTPELTEACIKSLRLHGGEGYRVVLFDNSDRRPLKKRMKGVKRIDNTHGQVIDFEKELGKYPDKEEKYAKLSNFGSAKHIMTVQKLWELLPEGFILLESDTLVVRDIGELWQEEYAAVGKVQWHQPGNKYRIPRFLPFLLYMNVPKLVENGARFFDPERCWALQKGVFTRGNWYDTGAALLEDVRKGKPELVGRVVSIERYIVHYKGGSWKKDLGHQLRWLERRKKLFT